MKLPEHFFEEIINYAPNGIIIMDTNGTIYYINESAKSMCGWRMLFATEMLLLSRSVLNHPINIFTSTSRIMGVALMRKQRKVMGLE